MGRCGSGGVINGEAVVPGRDVCRHGVKQRSGDMIAVIVSVESPLKGAQFISNILSACDAGGNIILVVGLSQINGLGVLHTVASLFRVDIQPDFGNHLVRQIQSGKADDADIVVAGIVEFLTGHIVLGIGGGGVFARAERRDIS